MTLVISICFALFAGLINRLRGLKVGQLRFLVLKLKDFGSCMPHGGFIGRKFDILNKFFTMANVLVYLPKY